MPDISQAVTKTTKPDLHDADSVERFRRARRIDPDRIRRMRYGLYRMHEPIDTALMRLDVRLGTDHAAAARDVFNLDPFEIVERHDSKHDFSSKLVLRAADNRRIETVLIRASTGRTSVCVSTQVGCDAGCPFCATAKMGLVRNLSASEIIEQVLIAARIVRQENRRVRNIVFMGMGEPFDNANALHEAVETLISPHRFAFAPKRLLVSTVGDPTAMITFSKRFPRVQMAVSLHSARPELRTRLIPRSKNHSWDELRNAIQQVAGALAQSNANPVMIEHLMIDGVNDQQRDADALIEFLNGIEAHVNLIPYNRIDGGPEIWKPSPQDRRDKFAKLLRDAGVFTTVRYSMGPDISAACGQLAQPTSAD